MIIVWSLYIHCTIIIVNHFNFAINKAKCHKILHTGFFWELKKKSDIS